VLASPVTSFRPGCCGRFDREFGCRFGCDAEAMDGFEMRSGMNAMALFVQEVAAPSSVRVLGRMEPNALI